MNDNPNSEINQDVSITIGYNTIEFEREHRDRGSDPGAWYKTGYHSIDKISKASMHRLATVTSKYNWKYKQYTSYYETYYGADFSEYDVFTCANSAPSNGNWITDYLRQLCGCGACNDELASLHPDDSGLK